FRFIAPYRVIPNKKLSPTFVTNFSIAHTSFAHGLTLSKFSRSCSPRLCVHRASAVSSGTLLNTGFFQRLQGSHNLQQGDTRSIKVKQGDQKKSLSSLDNKPTPSAAAVGCVPSRGDSALGHVSREAGRFLGC